MCNVYPVKILRVHICMGNRADDFASCIMTLQCMRSIRLQPEQVIKHLVKRRASTGVSNSPVDPGSTTPYCHLRSGI